MNVMAKGALTLGIAQMASIRGDVAANLEIIERFVADAVDRGVDLLVFPELAVSGYDVGPGFSDATVRSNSDEMHRLQEMSRRVAMVVGLIEETEDVQFYNSAVYMRQGKVRHVHRKVYLPTYGMFNEKRYFAAGWGVRAFDTPWGRMAVLICGDCWHMPLPYMAAHDGADLLINIAASAREGLTKAINSQHAWERMNRSYALCLSNFVAFANHAGQEGDLHFWGGSHIVRPDGSLAAYSETDQPDLVTAELDMNALRAQRLILPFRRDDSLQLTVELGRRILRDKIRRRDGLLTHLTPASQMAAHPPSVATESSAPPEWTSEGNGDSNGDANVEQAPAERVEDAGG